MFLNPAPPQIDRRAMDLLENVQAKLGSLHSLSAECRYTVSSHTTRSVRVEDTRVLLMRPNRVLCEQAVQSSGPTGRQKQQWPLFLTVASDGNRDWRVFHSLKEYETWPANSTGKDLSVPSGNLLDSFFDPDMSLAIRVEALRSQDALLSAEYMTRNWRGKPYRVAKLTIANPSGHPQLHEEVFVGEDGLAHRVMSDRVDGSEFREADLISVRLNPVLSDDRFAFKLPAGYGLEVSENAQPPALPIGSDVPAYQALNYDDKSVKLGDFRGKTIVLMFWATWCQPAISALPVLNQMAEDPNLAVVAVDIGDSGEAFKSWMRFNGGLDRIHFLVDPNALNSSARKALPFKIAGLPTQYVIDKTGKIAASFVGYSGDQELNLKRVLRGLRS